MEFIDRGKDISELRKSLGMSQANFAKLVDVSQQQLSKIEKGIRGLTPWRYSLIERMVEDMHWQQNALARRVMIEALQQWIAKGAQ